MSNMKFVVAFAAFIAFISTSSAMYITISASNNGENFNTYTGGAFNDEAAVMQKTTFDMTGDVPETTTFHSAFNRKDIFSNDTYDYAYQNHFVGNHVTGTYFQRHSVYGTYESSFEIDI